MIAEWVKILITAVVGFTSAVLVDILKNQLNDRRKRKGLRKAMYDELAAILGTCDAVLEVKNPNRDQAEMLMKVLFFSGHSSLPNGQSRSCFVLWLEGMPNA